MRKALQRAIAGVARNGAQPGEAENASRPWWSQLSKFGRRSRGAQPEAAVAQKAAQPQHEPEIDLTQTRVYPVAEPRDEHGQLEQWQNVDGWRVDDGRYGAFKAEAESIVPKDRIIDDSVRTFAYSTDASFYRLLPKVVVKVHNEAEVAELMQLSHKHQTPVTFRAAGTSLSGQAQTDSVMLKLSHSGRNFRGCEIHEGGKQVTVEPGIIGGEVNKKLAEYRRKNKLEQQYKIGPDPASLESAMMGGIIANNSSGMCCGVTQNTYNTLQDMRVILPDGYILDTSSEESREDFLRTHSALVAKLQRLAERVQSDKQLVNLINKKYKIKNTNGYSINALVDFPVNDPIEIVKRLMIGSEGTLGFVSQATYNTVPDDDYKASSFMLFDDVDSACTAANEMRERTNAAAIEIFDTTSLWQCQEDEKMTSMVPGLKGCPQGSAALLVECRGNTSEKLDKDIEDVSATLADESLSLRFTYPRGENYPFIKDELMTKVFWNFRKGLIPIVGGARDKNTVMLLEDVCCPTESLAEMTKDLTDMFKRHGYSDASLFGHAMNGNLHTVFSQGFRDNDEIERFCNLMKEMSEIVATKHGGSLKGEHGTGRNMAPFVELEWGTKAYETMWEIKEIFDPDYLLNPGVILANDEATHAKNLKPCPPANNIVDHCIECGFCESNCPSRDVTLTPRQRITVLREMSRLEAKPSLTSAEEARLREFQNEYKYLGEATCAADGMCQEKCPVSINTGDLIKHLRTENLKESSTANGLGNFVKNHFKTVTGIVPPFLNTIDFMHGIVGPKPLEWSSALLNRASRGMIPTWNAYMPKGAPTLSQTFTPESDVNAKSNLPRKVVYMPSCVTRMMGPARGDKHTEGLSFAVNSVLSKAGYEVVYPNQISGLCCGMMFNSRGLEGQAAEMNNHLETELLRVSEDGKLPIIIDNSPCLSTVKDSLQGGKLGFSLYDPVDFVSSFLLDKLHFDKKRENVHLHVPCSSKKHGKESTFYKIASHCSDEVTPSGIPCCGMAGERGMRFPELTASSLQHVEVPSNADGFSGSKTCEIAMSQHSNLHHRHLIYLVDECASPRRAKASA